MSDSATKKSVQVLTLGWTAEGSAFGLTVTFGGAVPVTYKDRPPGGSVILDFAFEGKEERVVWTESDWGDAHEIFGFGYRVLNKPELKPKELRVEVRDRAKAGPA